MTMPIKRRSDRLRRVINGAYSLTAGDRGQMTRALDSIDRGEIRHRRSQNNVFREIILALRQIIGRVKSAKHRKSEKRNSGGILLSKVVRGTRRVA